MLDGYRPWYTKAKMIFPYRVEVKEDYLTERVIDRFCKTVDEAKRYCTALLRVGKRAYVVERRP